jgi:hypothetical protein
MHPNESAADLALQFRSPNGSNPSYVPTIDKKPKGIMKGTQQSVPAVVNMPQAAVIPPVADMPPHTSTRGYGHPVYSSNLAPPSQPTPPASYMNIVPSTPYSHHASFAYTNQSQATSMGTALRGIKTRNSVSRKDLHWNGNPSTFETYKDRLFGIMQQNGTSYLGNVNFLNEYMTNPSHIHSGTFWDRFGITAQQCMADISWLNGVLTTTIDDPDNIPELNSASGDGVIALANLAAVYSNNGATEQDTRWNIHDQINKEFDPSTMSLAEYMRNFQTFVLKHQRFNANYGREEVLDQLKKEYN